MGLELREFAPTFLGTKYFGPFVVPLLSQIRATIRAICITNVSNLVFSAGFLVGAVPAKRGKS